MPMCDSGVPERHTTAVSSSKIGARNVAPASATHATTPSAVVSISVEHVVGRGQPAPRAAHGWRLEHARSDREINRVVGHEPQNLTRYHRPPCRPTTGLSDQGYVLLHEVRLRGLIEIEDGRRTRSSSPDSSKPGSSTPVRAASGSPRAGRAAHAAMGARVAGSEIETAVTRGYERFLPLNVELLRVCNDWQVRPGGVPNDHRDAQYDWSVIDRLRDARRTDRARCSAASPATSPGSRATRRRLRAALQRVDDGEHEWFTSPRIDSYHTVWMQLHEDLLLALGLDRASEPQP